MWAVDVKETYFFLSPKFLRSETEQVKKETRSGKINKADHA